MLLDDMRSVSVSDFVSVDMKIKACLQPSSPLSWEQSRPKWTQYAAHSSQQQLVPSAFPAASWISLIFKFLPAPPPPPPPLPTPAPHSTPSSLLLPSPPPSPPPAQRGPQLRIIAFDRRGLWLRDWALTVESTGSIPPIPPFGSHWAWWQCWHSTCSPTGLIKSEASIWVGGQRGSRRIRSAVQ